MFLDIHPGKRSIYPADHGCICCGRYSGRQTRHFGCFDYILLGAVGLPVFAGFSGGMGVILGTTGGYIAGFLFSALLMWGIETAFGRSKAVLAVSMAAGLLVCYAFGTIWFIAVYARNSGSVALSAVLAWCVIPFIIPDLIKIAAALLLTGRLRKALPW